MINFYNRFIKNAAAILKPLYEAQGKSKPQEPLDWSDVMTEAFSSSKTALVNATMLTHPAHGAPIALTSVPQTLQSVLSWSSYPTGRGNPWPSSANNFAQLKRNIAPSTGNFLDYIWQLNILGTFWRADVLPCSLTTNLLSAQCRNCQIHGRHASKDI
ncbi:Pol polyprotein [Elysia marginata]|uniref:Pol polyprotein n=1 Tax=Elysia marginata TaxID=1093978 RepID=A0AAV4IUN4_9GAST|nr:Pol polyprotein [Elysia marginata]